MQVAATKRGCALLVFTAVVALTAYPPSSALLNQGLEGAFRYFVSDSFYYLSVADHSIDAPFFTFDGTHPTNGFHPLWQLYLERSFFHLGLGGSGQIWFTAISGIVLVSTGTGLFALALLRLTRRPALVLLGTVPGVFYLVMPRFNPNHGSQWSFANGMETPLSIFMFGLLAYALFNGDPLRPRRSQRPLLAVSLILTLITLSRLDDIFIFVPFLLCLALSSNSRRSAVRRVAVASVIPVVAIGGYLAFNLSYAESALPSSGAAKSQPLWAFARNVYALMTTTAPFADPLARGNVAWNAEAWRITQMLVPLFAGLWWLATRPMTIRPIDDAGRRWENSRVGVLAGYAVLKSGYNFTTVSLWDQGQWYYPLTIMTFNLITMVSLARILDERRARQEVLNEDRQDSETVLGALLARWPAVERLPVATVAAFALVLISANAFVDMKQAGKHSTRNFRFWQERDLTQRRLDDACPGCGILSFDDGIVSYSLERTPTLNGLGLVLDKEAARAREDGRLLDVAWERGHRLLVSVNYAMAAEAYTSPSRLRSHLVQNRHLHGEQLDDWNFEVAFKSPSGRVSFIRFQPKDVTSEERHAREMEEEKPLESGPPGPKRRVHNGAPAK